MKDKKTPMEISHLNSVWQLDLLTELCLKPGTRHREDLYISSTTIAVNLAVKLFTSAFISLLHTNQYIFIMKFSAVLALVSAVAISALPTDASGPNLVARANDVSNLPSKACRCGGSDAGAVSYAAGDIKKAADKELEHVLAGTIVGKDRSLTYRPNYNQV